MSENMCTLEMKDISIEFPGVKALNNVNFTMRSGEIRAVVGANGAGKSTLMKVLAGANETYTGDIFIDSQHYELRTPRAAKDLGIELVYQEVDTALFPYLTVGENIMFNSIVTGMKGRAMIRWRKINKSARDILRQLNMDIDVTRKMSSLTLAQKQMVLIARAVREQCRFLILDEPTAPLSLGEVAELFRIVKELASKKNVGIIFISHRLPELFQICQSLTVMKDGQVVANRTVDSSLTVQDIVNLMLGRSFEENFPKIPAPIGDVVIEVEHLRDGEGRSATSHSAYAVVRSWVSAGWWARGRPNSANFCSGRTGWGRGRYAIRASPYRCTARHRRSGRKLHLCPKSAGRKASLSVNLCISICPRPASANLRTGFPLS